MLLSHDNLPRRRVEAHHAALFVGSVGEDARDPMSVARVHVGVGRFARTNAAQPIGHMILVGGVIQR